MNRKAALLLALLLGSGTGQAYTLFGRWLQPERTLYFKGIDLKGEERSESGPSWDEGVLRAIDRWNQRAPFRLRHEDHPRWRSGRLDPSCAGPDRYSTIVFRRMNCNLPFQEGELAVTVIWSHFDRANPSPLPIMDDADIIVNANFDWDIFDGPSKGGKMNFVQVVTHELGHLMGLDHDASGVPALLHPTGFNGLLEFPQLDDLLGIQSLYGGEIKRPEVCERKEPLSPGQVVIGKFVPEDCRRVDVALSVLDSDDSAVHRYEVSLPEGGVPLFVMRSEEVDPLLELRDERGELRLKVADDFGGTSDAVLFHPLPAGKYQLLANTALVFSQFGPYTLEFHFAPSSAPPSALLDLRDSSIAVPAIRVGDQVYWARLLPAGNNLWRLGPFGPTSDSPREAVFLPDGSLFFSAAEAFGDRYDALFRRCPPPECPSDTLYWRLEAYWRRQPF